MIPITSRGAALARISAHSAAVARLCVPVLVAAAGTLLLAEPLSPRIVLSGSVILLGIARVTLSRVAPDR